ESFPDKSMRCQGSVPDSLLILTTFTKRHIMDNEYYHKLKNKKAEPSMFRLSETILYYLLYKNEN
ncbi:MAG: hypothetical protein ACOYVF_06015, partial [Candidatus Zixiibacteriota bacterium]